MGRGTQIKELKDDDASSSSMGKGEAAKASKRRCVQSACVPCRKRKSKCDGGTPVCATCTAVYKTDCYYDSDSEGRRGKTTAQKRDSSSVTGDANDGDNASFLIHSIRNLPETEAYELIQHIRKDQRLDISGLADTWRKTVTLPLRNHAEPQSLEGDLSVLLGKPAITQLGESRHFGHTSSLGLVAEDENYTGTGLPLRRPSVDPRPGTWTTVTQDMAFVERLLELYFKWSHPFYVIFSRECFLNDFYSGRQKYCSSLLVNAILAYACHFTDEPQARTDPENFRTAGDHFFAEARRLLYEDESPSLVTTQALCVMGMREPSAGRDSSGFMYSGRCMRMAVELGLHLNNSVSPSLHLTPSEIEVRKVTFWGCFTVDTVWSVCIGRISQIPCAAITLDKPILEEHSEGQHANSLNARLSPDRVPSRVFLQEFSSLSELVNDNNYMFFAPKERFTSRRLLDCYNRYQRWYKNLPPSLRISSYTDVSPPPHIIALHMLYHTVVLHLFRPLLKVDLLHSDIRPRDICIDSANKVSELLRLYRRHYDLRACQLVLTHILLSICIVHLLYSKDYQMCSDNLVEGLQGLEALHICHYFGARSFKIVHALAQNWNLPFPEALKNSKLVPQPDARIESPPPIQYYSTPDTAMNQHLPINNNTTTNNNNNNNYGSIERDQVRRESLSMFAPEHTNMHGPAHPQPSHSNPMVNMYSPNAAHPYGTAPQPADTLFWSPMPGVGVPIIPRSHQLSPMDLNNMLGNADEWDKFGRDGFKMSDTWVQETLPFHVSSHEHAQSAYPPPPPPPPPPPQPPGHDPAHTDMPPAPPGYEWWAPGGSGPPQH